MAVFLIGRRLDDYGARLARVVYGAAVGGKSVAYPVAAQWPVYLCERENGWPGNGCCRVYFVGQRFVGAMPLLAAASPLALAGVGADDPVDIVVPDAGLLLPGL